MKQLLKCSDENLKERLGDNNYNGLDKLSQGFSLT